MAPYNHPRLALVRLVLLPVWCAASLSGLGSATEEGVQPRAAPDVSISVSPNPARPGQPVTVLATSSQSLSYLWSFMGEAATTDNPATCVYTDIGGHLIFLRVTDSSGMMTQYSFAVIVTDTTTDVDGDGVANAMETALGTDPTDPVSTPAIQPQPGQFEYLFLGSVRARIRTAEAGKDSLSISFQATEQVGNSLKTGKAAVCIGGLVKVFSFVRDKRRLVCTPDSQSKDDKLSMRLDSLGWVKMTMRLSHGTFYEALKDSLQSGTILVPVFAVVGDRLCGGDAIWNVAVRNGVITTSGKGESLPRR